MGYQVGGSVFNGMTEYLVKELLKVFPQLEHRPRVFGYDIQLILDDLELYLNTFDENTFSIEATFLGEEKDLLSLLRKLRDVFLSLGLKFHIWYCMEDEEGKSLSEEIIFFDNHNISE